MGGSSLCDGTFQWPKSIWFLHVWALTMYTSICGHVLLILLTGHGAHGHGAVTKPVPRGLDGDLAYCPWCVGEHQPDTNPSGKAHHDAVPSTPCMGTTRGSETYTAQQFGRYRSK